MEDEEVEKAFSEAQEQWRAENRATITRGARYFFLAGVTFGMEAAAKIHDKVYGEEECKQ